MDRRAFSKVIAAMGCGTVTGTSTVAQAQAATNVAFALFPGYLALMKQHVFDPYNKANPQVSIAPLQGPASQTYAQLLASPASSRSIQGGMMNDPLSWAGVTAKLWDPMTSIDVPHLETVPVALRNDAGIPWVFNGFGISYNPEKLPNGIDSWKDLYSRSLKGKVAMWPAYFDAYAMAAVAAGGGSTEIEKGIEQWKKAKDNIGMWITSVAELHQAMHRGEIWAAPDFLSTTVRDARAGMKLAMSLPAEGAVLNTYQLVSVSGNTPAQRQAVAGLINLSLGEQAQAAAFDAAYLTPANARVKVDARKGDIPGLKGYDFTATEAVKRFYKIDYKWIGANASKIKKLIEDNLH